MSKLEALIRKWQEVERERDEARAEIARLEKELAECREELAGAVLTGREDRLRATEAERKVDKWRDRALPAEHERDRYREALERIAELGKPFEARIAREALDTQAREGHGSAD